MTLFNSQTQGRPLPMGQLGQSEQLPPLVHKTLKKNAKLCNIVTATTSLLN
jgi:hypothetical protein